jgi:RNA polymerase sigma-70 factor (ECF subfamily)
MEADDLLLVSQAKTGDTAAFRALVVRYQRKVYAVALGVVKDPDLAWDVAQEAFVRVHQHLGEFEGKSSFSTWLFRIATHLSIDAVRRERRSKKDDLDDVDEGDLVEGGEGILSTSLGDDPRANLLRRELAGKIQDALATLPEKHRTILVLREVEGLSYEELAERLDLHKGTVMSRLFHARKKMQAALRRYAGAALGRAAGETQEKEDEP